MHSILRRLAVTFWACVALALIAALSNCVNDSGSAIVVDGGTTIEEGGVIFEDGGAAIYKVSGTASGIPTGQSVTLTMNGGTPLMVPNGTFTFPDVFALGQTYVVAMTQMPASHSCALTNASGKISGNVTNVTVACQSTDATLSALSVSAGAISPAFNPATLAYTAQKRISAALPPGESTTVTATTTDPNATITINGTKATSGMPSAPITLKSGVLAIDVAVTAPDGKTTKHYAVAFTSVVNDFIRQLHPNGAGFSTSVALSADGNTLAVGTPSDPSNATGANGNEQATGAYNSGAVYIFKRTGGTWAQEAYLKPAYNAACADFGCGGYIEMGGSVALSSDGNTLVAGGAWDWSKAGGIGADPSQQDVTYGGDSGAVYVFTRAGATWSQQQYIKALNAHYAGWFGRSVALSSDGNTLAVGEDGNRSNTTGVQLSDPPDALTDSAGAVYVYTRSGTTWSFQAMLKASNARTNAYFGYSVALSSDGNTLAAGAYGDSSNATGINPVQTDTSADGAGAVFVFTRAGTTWSQQAYIKASNTRAGNAFGRSVALASDGNTLAVGAAHEEYYARVVVCYPHEATSYQAGAGYVFTRSGTTWSQQAYVKASNTPVSCSNMSMLPCGLGFGFALTLSADGNVLVAGAGGDSSNATGINGDSKNTMAFGTGAAHVFVRAGTTWAASNYVKASNLSNTFGMSMACSSDCKTLAIGSNDNAGAGGINGSQTGAANNGGGAVYVF